MKVFLTVDTELWPLETAGVPAGGVGRDAGYEREEAVYFDGVTDRGSFGIEYQLDCLRRNGLKSSWFVEPLFSCFAGKDMLARVINRILAHGQEIGLHLHPEWLRQMTVPGLPQRSFACIRDYSVDEQAALLAWGRDRLVECGAPSSRVFRAGNFGAGRSTLSALRQVGIPCDSSFNPVLPISFPEIVDGRFDRHAPEVVDGVLEVPMSHFATLAERARPAQVCACSASEIEQALESARRCGWPCFVILWHSGELVRRGNPLKPYAFNVRRFERLCRYLGENRDRFLTSHFAELLPPDGVAAPTASARVGPRATIQRVLEQAVSRNAMLEQMLVS